MNRRVHPAFTIIFALGVLGFVYLLTTNPGRLFTMLLSVVIIGAVVFFLFRWLMNRRIEQKEIFIVKQSNNQNVATSSSLNQKRKAR